MKVAIHDYAGHPFVFELSRQLARDGYEVRHYFFAADIGPKGPDSRAPGDPASFSIHPIAIDASYSKSNFLQRRTGDILYGKAVAAALTEFRPDVVISGNTPLEAQQILQRATRSFRGAFVFWMQDFYSLAIMRIIGTRWMGLGRMIAEFYKQMESALLKQSQQVVLISNDFRDQVSAFGVSQERVSVIPNWGAIDSIPSLPKDNDWARSHGLADKFVFLYSGTLALKHNPDLLWELADAFKDDPDVRVVVAAAGVSVDTLKARQSIANLPNLVFLPLQPIEVFPEVLASADVLVALLENDAGEFSVPSKVLSYLCAGRPILLSAPLSNLAVQILGHAQAGCAVPAGNVAAFCAKAQTLRADLEERRRLGAAGRKYAEATFSIDHVSRAFGAVFSTAVARLR